MPNSKNLLAASTITFTGILFSGCSEINALIDDVQNTTNTALVSQDKQQEPKTTVNKKVTNQPSKQDMVDVLWQFERSCGFEDALNTEGTAEYIVSQRYDTFKDTFMLNNQGQDDNYKAYVDPNYRTRLPAEYNRAIKDITVDQDNGDVHYYVNFQNATYRGFDLDKLEVFYRTETDYVYDVLHFKNTDFVELKPLFKSVPDMDGNPRGGTFDVDKRSITCYYGM